MLICVFSSIRWPIRVIPPSYDVIHGLFSQIRLFVVYSQYWFCLIRSHRIRFVIPPAIHMSLADSCQKLTSFTTFQWNLQKPRWRLKANEIYREGRWVTGRPVTQNHNTGVWYVDVHVADPVGVHCWCRVTLLVHALHPPWQSTTRGQICPLTSMWLSLEPLKPWITPLRPLFTDKWVVSSAERNLTDWDNVVCG